MSGECIVYIVLGLMFFLLIVAHLVVPNHCDVRNRHIARGCRGRDWRRAFPTATKEHIRLFVRMCSEACGFWRQPNDLLISPFDYVIATYEQCNPELRLAPFGKGPVDYLPLHELAWDLEKAYGITFDSEPTHDITFGKLFSLCLRGTVCLDYPLQCAHEQNTRNF